MSQTSPGDVPAPPPGPDSRRPRALAVLIGVVVVAVVGAGFVTWRLVSHDDGPTTARAVQSSSPSPTAPSATASETGTDPRLDRFYAQSLDWHGCGRDECAQLTVPLDYADPTGTTIRLAVLKVPAADQKSKVGALVVNPGGPGGSGVQYAAGGSLQFGTPLSEAFDIVGFDPRGVGQSDPLRCVSTAQLDKLVGFDPDPDNRAERQQMDRLIHRFGQGCLNHSGALARHMSTEEVARDLDILRAALGEKKLDYLGASYGTLIGATYADMFPHRVGRFVLDGALDPALSNEQLSLEQAQGFETALRAYVQDCVDAGSCFLGDSVDAGTHRIRAFLDQVEKQPLPTGTDRDLSVGLATLGVWLPLYVKSFWPRLTSALKQAMNDANGSELLALADLYTSRGPDGYTDNSMEALYAVNCLDHDDYIPTEQVPAHFAQFEKVSPTFGRAFAFGAVDLQRVAGEESQAHGRAARRGRAADRGRRHDPRPGDAAALGPGPGQGAGLRSADHPRR